MASQVPTLSGEPLFPEATLRIQNAVESKTFKPSVPSTGLGGIFTSANQLLVGELRGIQAAKVSGQGHGCIRGDRQSLCREALHPWIQPTVN